MKKALWAIIALAVVSSLVLTACVQPTPQVMEEVEATSPPSPEEEAVTFPERFVFCNPSPAVMSYNVAHIAPPLMGALRERGVEVEPVKYKGYQPFVAGLLKGECYFGAVSFPSLVNSSLAGVELKSPLGHTRQLLWVMLAAPDIESWEDLNGKTVAYHSEDSTTNIAARALLEAKGVDLDSISWAVIPGTPNRVIALEEGRIDATTVSLESAVDAEKRGIGHILGTFAETFPGHINDVYVLSPELMESNPKLANWLIGKLRENINWVREAEPEEIADVVIETGFHPDYDKSVWVEAYRRLKELEMFPKDGRIEPEAVERSQELLLGYGLIEGTVNYDDIVAVEYQPESP